MDLVGCPINPTAFRAYMEGLALIFDLTDSVVLKIEPSSFGQGLIFTTKRHTYFFDSFDSINKWIEHVKPSVSCYYCKQPFKLLECCSNCGSPISLQSKF